MALLSEIKGLWLYSSLRKCIFVAQNRLFDKPISQTESPVFIVGCGHSGTTLMAALLGRHDNLYLIPYETGIFHFKNSGNQVARFFSEKSKETSGKRLLEKTPRHVHRIGRIFRLFPKAQIIGMMRDGRDVACSIRKRNGNLEQGVRRWLKDCKALEEYMNDPRLMVVRYEDLVLKSENTIGKILEFLNESGDPKKLLEDQSAVSWSGASPVPAAERKLNERDLKHLERRKEQINKPIYDGRGLWREQMNNEEHDKIIKVAGETLTKWGYSDQENVKK
jgi:protein O-GlcNAc transferase